MDNNKNIPPPPPDDESDVAVASRVPPPPPDDEEVKKKEDFYQPSKSFQESISSPFPQKKTGVTGSIEQSISSPESDAETPSTFQKDIDKKRELLSQEPEDLQGNKIKYLSTAEYVNKANSSAADLFKQGDLQGAIHILNDGIEKTKGSYQGNLYAQRANIWAELGKKKSKADVYIDLLKGFHDNSETDEQWFKEQEKADRAQAGKPYKYSFDEIKSQPQKDLPTALTTAGETDPFGGTELSDFGKTAMGHVGEFIKGGAEGIIEGVKKIGKGADLINISQMPEPLQKFMEKHPDYKELLKENPDNRFLRGVIKGVAGTGEAGFAALMHLTPTGAAITEATVAIESGINAATGGEHGTKLVQYLFAPISSIAELEVERVAKQTGVDPEQLKQEVMSGTTQDLLVIGDFASIILGGKYAHKYGAEGAKKVKDKIQKGFELTAEEFNDIGKALVETAKDPAELKKAADQAGLKLKDESVIDADLKKGFTPVVMPIDKVISGLKTNEPIKKSIIEFSGTKEEFHNTMDEAKFKGEITSEGAELAKKEFDDVQVVKDKLQAQYKNNPEIVDLVQTRDRLTAEKEGLDEFQHPPITKRIDEIKKKLDDLQKLTPEQMKAREDFVQKNMEDVAESEKVKGIDYEQLFRNIYDRKSVDKPLKQKTDANSDTGSSATGGDKNAPSPAGQGGESAGKGILQKGTERGDSAPKGGKALKDVEPVDFKDIPDVTFQIDGWEYTKKGNKISEKNIATGKKSKINPIDFADDYHEHLQRESQKVVKEEKTESIPEPKPEGKVEDKPAEGEVKPIRQLGTGANVYFETDKYRVNDSGNGKILLNVGDAKSEVPLANIEFDGAKEAVYVAEKLNENAPDGLISDYHNIEKIVDNYRKEYNKEFPPKEKVGQDLSKRVELEKRLTEAQSELSDAQSAYDKANKTLSKDLGKKQGDMFAGTEQKLFDDAADIKKEVDARKKVLDVAKEKVDNLQKQLDDTLEGQTEINSKTTDTPSDQLLEGDRDFNKNSNNPDNAIGIINYSPDVFSFVADIPNKLKEKWQKYFTKEGDLPRWVFELSVKMRGEAASLAHDLSYNIKTFKKAVKEELGGKLKSEQIIELNDALAGNKPLSELTPKVADSILKMRSHIDRLSKLMIDNGMVEGKLLAKIQANMGAYLHRSYRVHDVPEWAEKVPFEIVNRAKNFIRKAYEDKGRKLSEDEVQGIINELLYKFDSETPLAILSGSKMGSKDLGVLKKRGDIAPEIRALWGEYNDPLVNYAKSVVKMSSLISRSKFLDGVKKDGMGKILFDKPTATHFKQIAAEGSQTMSPLNGLYTTREIKSAFENFSNSDVLPDWMALYMKVNGFAKYSKTILSFPITHVRNFIANIPIAIRNGNVNAGKIPIAAKTIFTEIANGSDVQLRDRYKKYLELGIAGEGINISEVKALIKDANKNMDSFESMTDGMLSKTGKAGVKGLEKLYEVEDTVFKIFNFESERAKYKEAFPEWTEEMLDKKAAEITRLNTPTYSEVPQAIQNLRRFPLVGTFVSFPYEMIRTTFNNAALGVKELKDKKTRPIGAKRLAGTMAALALPSAISQFTKAVNNISGDDDESIRNFLPPWMKNSEMAYIENNGSGKYKILDLGNTDPHNYLKKPIIALVNGENPIDATVDALTELFKPFLSEEMLLAKILDINRNKTVEDKQVYNEQDEIGSQIADMYGHVAKALEPGSLSSLKKIGKGVAGVIDPKTGEPFDWITEVTNQFTGQKIYTIDIAQSLNYKWKKLGDNVAEAKRIYNTAYYSKEASAEEKQKSYDKANNIVQELLNEASENYQAALKLGVPVSKIDELLRDARLNGLQKNVVKYGGTYNIQEK